MFRISNNIIFSAMVHSILLAAALLIGGSSEIRRATRLTVSFFDETDNSPAGRQVADADLKQYARTRVRPMTAMKTASQPALEEEVVPKQNPPASATVKPLADTESGSVRGAEGMDAQAYSSHVIGNGTSAISSQVSGKTGEAGSASRGQKGQPSDTGYALLRQRIRDALQANLVYPYIARKRRMEGTVHMEFRINQKGLPEGVRIVKGSSYAILDDAARETVMKASPFPAMNNIVEVPIRFSLRGD